MGASVGTLVLVIIVVLAVRSRRVRTSPSSLEPPQALPTTSEQRGYPAVRQMGGRASINAAIDLTGRRGPARPFEHNEDDTSA